MNDLVSKCCGAPVNVVGFTTQHWQCSQCLKACDACDAVWAAEGTTVKVTATYEVKLPRVEPLKRTIVVWALMKDLLWIDEVEERYPLPQSEVRYHPAAPHGETVMRWDYADKEEAYIKYVREHWTDRDWALFFTMAWVTGGHFSTRVREVDMTTEAQE